MTGQYPIKIMRTRYDEKPYEVTFEVMGRGTFPFDMLRHDRCFPKSQDDSANMYEQDDNNPRTVTLVATVRSRTWAPTEGRWSSFGWTVKTTVWDNDNA